MSKNRDFTPRYILLMLFIVTLGGLPLSGCANGSGGSGTNNRVLKEHMYSAQPSPYREHL
jgi:hypothetical protein